MARMIICKDCGEEKPNHGHGLCKRCYNIKWRKENPGYNKKWSKEHPESRRKSVRKWAEANPDKIREAHLRRFYDITLTEYDKMLKAQNNVCAICGATPEESGRRLLVDHDHETGEIRGLLCYSCNVGLGHFRDNPHNLAEAIKYILD